MKHRRKTSGFFDFWEKPLFYLAVMCLIVLFLSQALLLKETARHYLSWVDRLEGDPIYLQTPVAGGDPVTVIDHSPVANPVAVQREHRIILVRMLVPAKSGEVFVLVNGGRAGDLGQGELSLTVYEGDYLEIDARRLNEAGRFVISISEPGVVSPRDGLLLEGKEQVIPVGKVKFSQ